MHRAFCMFIARGCKRTKSVKITPNKKKKTFFLEVTYYFFNFAPKE